MKNRFEFQRKKVFVSRVAGLDFGLETFLGGVGMFSSCFLWMLPHRASATLKSLFFLP